MYNLLLLLGTCSEVKLAEECSVTGNNSKKGFFSPIIFFTQITMKASQTTHRDVTMH